MKLYGVLVLICFCSNFSISRAENLSPELQAGKMIWPAFQCSTYAELAKRKEEQKQLFLTGYHSAQIFVNAVNDGKITYEEISSNIPWKMSMILFGPTVEFVIGKLYYAAISDAFDEVVKLDVKGDWLPILKRPSDDLIVVKANGFFMERNCYLLK